MKINDLENMETHLSDISGLKYQNLDFEKAIIGFIVKNNNHFKAIREQLTEEHFYFNDYRKIYKAIEKAYSDNPENFTAAKILHSVSKEYPESKNISHSLFECINSEVDFGNGYKVVIADSDIQILIDTLIENWKKRSLRSISDIISIRLGTQAAVKTIEEADRIIDNLKQSNLKSVEDIPKPDFPLWVLPNGLQKIISELNATLNFSIDSLALSAMFSLAVMNGNKYKLRVKNGWDAPSIFWFAIVGLPGTIKTHPLNLMLKPIKAIDKQNYLIYMQDKAHWDSLSDNDKKRNRKPQYKQMLVNDYTLEALHMVHSHNPKGIGLHKDELVGFLNDMNKYRSGSDEQFWLESFNNSNFIVNRVTKDPMMIENIMINIIGTIQPDVLSETAKKHQGNGLIDRFLFTAAETQIHPLNNKEIDPQYLEAWNETIKRIEQNINYVPDDEFQGTEIISMSEECFNQLLDVDKWFCFLQNSDEETEAMKGYLSKMKTYMPRFVLLMVLFDGLMDGGVISVEPQHIERARHLCIYFIHSAKKVFADTNTKTEMNEVLNSLKGKTKAEKIHALHKKGLKNKQIADLLETNAPYVSRVLNGSNQ